MKISRVAILVGMFFLFQVASADIGGDSQQVYSFEINNDTPNYRTTLIPVTTIRPGVDKVVGYQMLPYKNATTGELLIGLYDSIDNFLSGELLGENESAFPYGIVEWFPYPKKIQNGVVVRQGSWSTVIVYFVRI